MLAKKNTSNCKTCKISQNFQLINIQIADFKAQLKYYSGINSEHENKSYSFSYKTESNLNQIINILRTWKYAPYIPQQNSDTSLISIILFTNKDISKNSILLKKDIYGLLVYYKTKNMMLTTVCSTKENKVLKIEKLSQKTKILSSNDIYNISKLLQFRNGLASSIAFINFNEIINSNIVQSDLQLQIKHMNNPFQSSNKFNPYDEEAHGCSFPCSEFQGYCVAQEGQTGREDWICISTEPCKKEFTDATLKENKINYDFEYQNKMLRKLTDGFLINSTKGQWYIENYYFLSSKFENDNVSMGYYINAYNIINSNVIPIIIKLFNNTNGNLILFDSSSASQMITLCEQSKLYFSDEESKLKIQQIINDINYYTNKQINVILQDFN